MGALLSRPFIVVVGVLYPMYRSFRAAEDSTFLSIGSSAIDSRRVKWLNYWVVFAAFQAVEYFTDRFLPWLPAYHWLKMYFVWWLISPRSRGAEYLYRLYVCPMLMDHSHEIQQFLERSEHNWAHAEEDGHVWIRDQFARLARVARFHALQLGSRVVNAKPPPASLQ
eukprot:TRINITY_DN84176_c0_g1_i1.p1 TRINITY_DN84176_c0_g1~~TRINITY_DN84176_c0_g1_i1.p1  ORF type:complete len:167 (+),score=64.59 TRINITY_DN84176_c0_g1_i1:71-571(+)